MRIGPYKYLSPFILFLAAWLAFTNKGSVTFLPVIYAFVFIPLIELLIRPDVSNLSAAEEEMAKADKTYDYILYLILPLQYVLLLTFLFSLQQDDLSTVDKAGRIISMGLLCGVFGINVAHELGHRVNKTEQLMAKALLLTSLYTHFFIEHNKGHHKNVATHEDPSSARYNESVFAFYPRTLLFTYLSAWKIANQDVQKKGKAIFSLQNEMLQLQLVQLSFVITILAVFGWKILGAYLIAALIGMLLLECVNYIEHYGLSRKQTASGQYERTMPHHSWNSNHVVGRLMLFELSRHSDHHYLASRKYQVLRHHDHSMQMPTGYPGMMILAHIPPLWFYIMNKRIKKEAPVAMPLTG
ncbi:alkane 1-monooxygenase [Lacibacter sp.]|uniref:alkane 1-monooxygenase n=1 Tax=Lacibacter sp. TaxID=1915409 RepID=UPI002B4B6193|nr:alkane 1-monooxygenase [Lacibacter sp.]HLP37815.1 alkane 1-monooxygenase [Lacibacter sp.]